MRVKHLFIQSYNWNRRRNIWSPFDRFWSEEWGRWKANINASDMIISWWVVEQYRKTCDHIMMPCMSNIKHMIIPCGFVSNDRGIPLMGCAIKKKHLSINHFSHWSSLVITDLHAWLLVIKRMGVQELGSTLYMIVHTDLYEKLVIIPYELWAMMKKHTLIGCVSNNEVKIEMNMDVNHFLHLSSPKLMP